MTRTNVKLAIVLMMVLSTTELQLIGQELFSQAVINYLFPKDLDIVRIRTLDEARVGRGVRILDFIGLVTRHGYPAEEHNITTEDGYNLKIHRIPDSPLSNNKENKKVLFLQHGIISSSDTWVLFGPGKDLAFLLADQGYDVWLGNFRGNTYSRSHVKLSPRDRDFWQFSFHEHGTIDLANMIDYVLSTTGEKSLYYIGHSMGISSFFVLLSTRPEYNANIKLGVCLAPIAFWNDVPPVLESFRNSWLNITEFMTNNDVYELFSLSASSIATRRVLCAEHAKTQALCIASLFLLSGSDPFQINTTTLEHIFTYYPTATSVLTTNHYYQNIITNNFRRYDHGFPVNYESIKSKRYELERITAPLAFIYGANDVLATKSNVYELYRRLPNVILLEEIPYKRFTHLDFIWAIDAKSLLYDRVIDIMEEFEDNQSNWNSFRADIEY